MRNFKNILIGCAVGSITFLYWLMIMTYGDIFRMEHQVYREEITLFFIVSAIVLNLVLIFLFYNKIEIKDKKSMIFVTAPFIVLMIITSFVSLNIPRLLDIVFIVLGSALIFEISKRKLDSYKPYLILGIYLSSVVFTYPLLYNFLEQNT